VREASEQFGRRRWGRNIIIAPASKAPAGRPASAQRRPLAWKHEWAVDGAVQPL